MNKYSIGQMVEMTGLPAKTIRFYEEQGVLTKPNRKANGYREYTQALLDQLKILKYARDMGLPLTEIKKLMKGCENGDCEHSHEYVESLIDAYNRKLAAQIKEMKILKNKLGELKNRLNTECDPKEKMCCNILTQLAEGGEDK